MYYNLTEREKSIMHLPKFLHKLPKEPSDPPKCKNYGALVKDHFTCVVRCYSFPTEFAYPYDEKETINILREQMNDKQGIIEVTKGITNAGVHYIATITKVNTTLESEIQYHLIFTYIKNDKNSTVIDSYCGEHGRYGTREAVVASKREVTTTAWEQDPYDPSYKKGLLMNESEKEEYDEEFPLSPLSQTRAILKYLIENN